MKREIIAAIDMGSHAIRMKIAEVDKSGKFRELESFKKMVTIGHDTFTMGRVGIQSVDQICSILELFKKSLAEYQVERYGAYATSAFREAANRDYIIDQIRLRTGIQVEILDYAREQSLTHNAIKNTLPDYGMLIREGAVIVVIGAGNIQVTCYKEGVLESSQNLKVGVLRIRETFENLEDVELRYNEILDEYITTNLECVEFFRQTKVYRHLIALGGEMNVVKQIVCSEIPGGDDKLHKSDFEAFYREVYDSPRERLEERFDIQREQAELLLPTMILFKKFLDNIQEDKIHIPLASLTDGILNILYEERFLVYRNEAMALDILASARVLGERFQYNRIHAEMVERNALLIFERTKTLHGLKKERLLLRVACILHDIGKFLSLNQHSLNSYQMIKSLEVFGLSKREMLLVANITRYHSGYRPLHRDESFFSLTQGERVLVAKLVAVLKLADALDKSHKQKILLDSVKLRGKELVIKGHVKATVNTTLEEWTFQKKADFFIEVFGIQPILKISKEL
ncbi:HD domain-containing protein [Anaerotalea alkaliphila]|uniref:HD domain-containing protein n=1 Tax=Anaerotalea alkaliphila TaxID=2662126 RepID=A0A7X5KN51_9FIRM|nr:HD domain-containing protein [Anaerotalea alkaliphila]NDL67664.1 HD domain-containing protein [Anaerotalea alkaliphila]